MKWFSSVASSCFFQRVLTRTPRAVPFTVAGSWEAVSGSGWTRGSSAHTLPPAANAQVNITAGRSPGLRRAILKSLMTGRLPMSKHSGCNDPYLRLPLRGQRRNCHYWLTVFPFNPLTEQSKGHLQTRGGGWLIYVCLSSRGMRNGLSTLPELVTTELLSQYHLLDFTGGGMWYLIDKLNGFR